MVLPSLQMHPLYLSKNRRALGQGLRVSACWYITGLYSCRIAVTIFMISKHLSFTPLCCVHIFVQGLKCLFFTGAWSHCTSLIHLSIKHSRSVLKSHKRLCMRQSVPASPAKALIVCFLSLQPVLMEFAHAVNWKSLASGPCDGTLRP